MMSQATYLIFHIFVFQFLFNFSIVGQFIWSQVPKKKTFKRRSSDNFSQIFSSKASNRETAFFMKNKNLVSEHTTVQNDKAKFYNKNHVLRSTNSKDKLQLLQNDKLHKIRRSKSTIGNAVTL